jgi:hypothetical protein
MELAKVKRAIEKELDESSFSAGIMHDSIGSVASLRKHPIWIYVCS